MTIEVSIVTRKKRFC